MLRHYKKLDKDFVIKLSVFINQKYKTYNSIIAIINWLTKIIYYEEIKVLINILGLEKVIINVIIQYYSFGDLIITNKGLVLISKYLIKSLSSL